MTLRLVSALCLALPAHALLAADPPLSAERIKADVTYLASDKLEGRAPGTRGEALTTDFLEAEFKKAGLKPLGAAGTYLQPVPLVRVATDPKATVRVSKGDAVIDFAAGEDFSGTAPWPLSS